MTTTIELGDISVDVVQKDIKNIHLSVYPPNGRVRLSAPARMDADTIRVYAVSKLAWIRRQQKKLQGQDRETPRELLERESHYLWGQRYLLKLNEADGPSYVELKANTIVLHFHSDASVAKKLELLNDWYRTLLKDAVQPLIAKWEPRMGVEVARFFVQRMKTKWGICNPQTRNIRLNLELAKKPPECLEYIVVHEMVHLLEPTHNHRFISLMDKFMPEWNVCRDTLNRLPVRHEEWGY